MIYTEHTTHQMTGTLILPSVPFCKACGWTSFGPKIMDPCPGGPEMRAYASISPESEVLHQAKVTETADRIAADHAELLDRLAEGPSDTEAETRGAGWCAPSP